MPGPFALPVASRALPRGCTRALPRGCARGCVPEPCRGERRRGVPEVGAGGMPLLGTAACPGRPPMWAGGVRQRSVPEGGRQRGAAVGNRRMPWEASYVGGRGAPEGVCQSPAAVLLFLRRCPLRAQVAEQGGVCLLQRLDTADRRNLAFEEEPVGWRFHFRRRFSILVCRNQEEKSAGRTAKGCRGIAPVEVFAGWQVERRLGVVSPTAFGSAKIARAVPQKMAPLCRRSGGTMACHVSVVPPAGRRIVRRAPFLVSSSVGRCLYPLPNTVFFSATSALFLEFSQFCCSSECPVETVVVFVLDVPHRFVGQKLFWELPALLLCSTGLWLLSFLRNIGLLALLCSTSLWMLLFLRNNGLLALLCSTGLQWTLGSLVFHQPLDVVIPPKQWPLQSLALHYRLEGPYLQKHSLQSLLVYTLCHGFWNHIGKLLQAPICVFFFFYIRVETVRSLLPEAVRRLQSRSGPLCALAYPRCLVHIRRQGSSGTGAYRVRGAAEGSSVDGRRCRMSLPFSASPPRPCILRRTESIRGHSTSVVGSPPSSRGTTYSSILGFPRNICEQNRLQRYSPGSISTAFHRSVDFGAISTRRTHEAFSTNSASDSANLWRTSTRGFPRACKTWIGFQQTSIPSLPKNFLLGCTSISRPRTTVLCSSAGIQYVVLQRPSSTRFSKNSLQLRLCKRGARHRPHSPRGAGSRRRRRRRRTSEAPGGGAGACGPGCRPDSRPGRCLAQDCSRARSPGEGGWPRPFRTVGPWTGRLLALPFGSSTLRGLVAVARYVFGSILALRAAQKMGGVGIWGAICGLVLRGRGGLEGWGGVCWQSLAGANTWLGTGPGGLCLLWFYGCGGVDVGWLLAKGALEYFGVLVPARLRPEGLAVYR